MSQVHVKLKSNDLTILYQHMIISFPRASLYLLLMIVKMVTDVNSVFLHQYSIKMHIIIIFDYDL